MQHSAKNKVIYLLLRKLYVLYIQYAWNLLYDFICCSFCPSYYFPDLIMEARICTLTPQMTFNACNHKEQIEVS